MGTVKYSGPVASFHCPTNAEIRSLKVHFNPKQEGTGDPSPENVRSIEGWDGVEINNDRENLFIPASFIRSSNGITFTCYTNGDIHVEGTATATTWLNVPSSMYFTITPGEYTISGNKINSNVSVYLVVSKANGGDIKFYTSENIPRTKFIDFTDNEARIQIAVSNGKTVNVTIHPKLERGSYTANTTTDYEFGVLGKNKFDGEYPDIKNSTNLTYRSIYVGNQIITASSNMPKTAEHQWSNLFILPGQVTSGAATGTNDFNIEVSRTITPIDGWITIAYRNEEGVDPREYQVQLEFGSSATEYEPYDPKHTVYGGWVDLITGEVCETHIKRNIEDFSSLQIVAHASGNIFHIRHWIEDMSIPGAHGYWEKGAGIYTSLSDIFHDREQSSGAIWEDYGMQGVGNSSSLYIKDSTISTTDEFINKYTGHYIVYNLNKPITYNLAPIALKTFLSTNNIWSNADYVEVEYDLHETQSILARKQFIIANQPHVETLAAAPLQSFETDMAAPLKECKVHFGPVQEGEGDPSPDNIRPISGWDNIITSLNRAPLPEEYQEVEYIQTNSEDSYIITDYYPNNSTEFYADILFSYNGAEDYPSTLFSSGDVFRFYKTGYYAWRYTKGTTDVRTSGYGTYSDKIQITTSGTTLTIVDPERTRNYIKTDGGSFVSEKPLTLFATELNGVIKGRWMSGYASRIYRFTLYEQNNAIRDYVPCYRKSDNEVGLYDLVNKTFLTHSGEGTFTAGPDITTGSIVYTNWTNEAGTIYGGYVDLVKGELVQTWNYIRANERTWSNYSAYQVFYTNKSDRSADSRDISDKLKSYTGYGWANAPDNSIISGNRNSMFIKHLGVSSNAEFKEWLDGVDPIIYYELAEPIHYTLTPTQLKTLRGTNNIWSSANDKIKIRYWKH